MAFMIRSVKCVLHNESEHNLTLRSEELLHGSYDTDLPARVPRETDDRTWKSSTCGFMTGTEGRLVFDVGATGATFEVYWDNPFIGDNTFRETCNGLADWEHVKPSGMNPDKTGDPLLDQEELEENDDVVIIYKFRTKRDQPGEPGTDQEENRDRQPDDADSKPLKIPPATEVMARDSNTNCRKIVFLGINASQADSEAAGLHQQVSTEVTYTSTKGRMEVLTTISPTNMREFKRKYEALKPTPSAKGWAKIATVVLEKMLPRAEHEAQRDKLEALLSADNTMMLAMMAPVLASVEAELLAMTQQPKTDAPMPSPMKRLALSGHHAPYHRRPSHIGHCFGDWNVSVTDHFRKFVADATYVPYRKNGVCQMSYYFSQWSKLGEVFPAAVAQVEDIVISACNTGHHKNKKPPRGTYAILHDFPQIFPNVQTVWAYEATAPSEARAVYELKVWERASRKSDQRKAISAAASKVRRATKWGPGWQSIVWTRKGDKLVPG